MPRPYTLEEVLNTLGVSPKQVLVNCALVTVASASWIIETSYFDVSYPDFRCRHGTNSIHDTIILSTLYMSMAVGGLMFGVLADLKGRLIMLQLPVFMNCYFTLIALFLEGTFWQEFVVKFVLLFSCSSYMMVSTVYFMEQLPSHSRGTLMMVSVAIGVLLGNLVLFYADTLQNTTLVWLFQRTPLFILLLMTIFLIGETIRYHELVGNYDAVMKQLHAISRASRKRIPKNIRFISSRDVNNLGNPKLMFKRQFITTIALSILFGLTFTSSQQIKQFCLMSLTKIYVKTFVITIDNTTELQPCTSDTAIQQLPSYFLPFTLLCEGVFLLLAATTVKLFGKKLLILLQIAACAGLYISLVATMQDTVPNAILMFITSALNPVISRTLLMFVTELYPTSFRATSLGFVSFLGYLLTVMALLLMSGVLMLSYRNILIALIVYSLFSGVQVTLLPTRFTTG